MMLSLGDVPAGGTLYIPFNTFDANGASVTISNFALADIKIYKNGSTTERASTSGFVLLDTDGIDFDGVTGIHGFSIDLSDNTTAGFYSVGAFYWIIISSITVNTQTVNFVAATFRIIVAESIAGEPKVDVAAYGGVAGTFSGGIPAVNTTQVGGTAQTAGDIAARLPAALVSGRIDASVGAMATDVLTSGALAASAVTEIQTGLATPTNITAGTITTVTNLTNAPTVGDLTATMKISVTTAATSATPTAAAVTGSVGSVVGLVASNLDTTVSSRSTYAGGPVASVTAGVTVSTNNDKTGYSLSAAAVQAIWDALTSALTTVGSIGKKLADWTVGVAQTGDSFARIGVAGAGLTALGDTRIANLDATVSSRATSAALATVQADTDDIQSRLPATLVGGRMDSSVGAVASGAIAAAAFAAGALDAVWSTATRLLTAGTNIVLAKGTGITGLNDLSAAQVNTEVDTALSDVGLTTTITGRIDAAVSSRLAAAGYTAPDNAGIASIATSVAGLPTANQNADALLDRANAIETGWTPRQALRIILSVLGGIASGLATTTAIFRNVTNTKNRVTATVDSSGNRTAVTLDAS